MDKVTGKLGLRLAHLKSSLLNLPANNSNTQPTEGFLVTSLLEMTFKFPLIPFFLKLNGDFNIVIQGQICSDGLQLADQVF